MTSPFDEAYQYAYAWYDRLSRNDLEKEIAELEKIIAESGRQYNAHDHATLFAARDKYYHRFHGIGRDPRKDDIPGKAGRRMSEIYKGPGKISKPKPVPRSASRKEGTFRRGVSPISEDIPAKL